MVGLSHAKFWEVHHMESGSDASKFLLANYYCIHTFGDREKCHWWPTYKLLLTNKEA